MRTDRPRLLILGGAGFLGHHLVVRLLRESRYRIDVVDRDLHRLERLAGSFQGRLSLSEALVTPGKRLEAQIGAADAVLSLTALCNPSAYNTRPLEVIRANYDDLIPLVELCAAKRRRLIHFSTCEVYGAPAAGSAPLDEEATPLILGPIHRERWTYACAKQLLERVIWAYGVHSGLAFTIVRPFNVIGPEMDFIPGVDGEGIPRVLACFMRSLLADEPFPLVDGGFQRRSFLYVEDFVEAVARILERPEVCSGQIINLGNPDGDISIAELARLMIDLYVSEHKRGRAETCVVRSEEFYGAGYDDAAVRIPDIEKARALLQWQPKTSLHEMLRRTIADYVARYGPALAEGGSGANAERR